MSDDPSGARASEAPTDDDPGNDATAAGDSTAESLGASVRSYVQRRIEWARETAARDREALATLPAGPWSAYGLLGAVVLVFSVLRLGITDLYTESLVFLVLVIVIGLLGWSLGIGLVLAHASFDLLISLAGGLTLKTFVGRLVTYIVLYALVVSIPSTQRALHARLDRVDTQYEWLDRVAAPASAVGAGALVYLWTEVAPYLVRTAFEFGPTVVAIATVQNNALLLSAWTIVVALAVAVGYQRRVGIMVTLPWAGEEMLIPGQFMWLRRLLRYGVVFVLVSGIITTALDIVLLAVALVAADLVLPRTAKLGPVRDVLLSVPYTVRLVLAFGITFMAARFFMALRYGPVAGSQFFPLVLSLAVGLFVFRLLLNVDEEVDDASGSDDSDGPREGSESAPGTPPAALLPLVTLVVALLALATVPDVALAHDCSSLADCESGARAGTAAGMSALVLALWYWTSGASGTFSLGGSPPPGGDAGAASEAGASAAAPAQATETDATGVAPEPEAPDDDQEASTRLSGAVQAGEAGMEEAAEEEDESDAAGEVKVVEVASGDGPETEYVVLRNVGDAHLDLSEWTVEDDAGHEYEFPVGVVLEPGTRLRLYTGPGEDTESAHYWGLDELLWAEPSAVVRVKNVIGDVGDSLTVERTEDTAHGDDTDERDVPGSAGADDDEANSGDAGDGSA